MVSLMTILTMMVLGPGHFLKFLLFMSVDYFHLVESLEYFNLVESLEYFHFVESMEYFHLVESNIVESNLVKSNLVESIEYFPPKKIPSFKLRIFNKVSVCI